ncbi:MAG: hypothetical protein ACHP7I_05325, partial [Terriglobales bacterium]
MAHLGMSLVYELLNWELESVRRSAGNGNLMDSSEQAKQELENIEQQIRHLENIAGENQEARKQLQVLHGQIESLRRQMTHAGPWQKTELARHPQRPYMLDYIERIFTDWSEIHGDRGYADDPAIIGGMARFHGEEVM